MSESADINVLVVDDNAANLLAIRAMLEDFDVVMIEAHSGEEALVLAEQHDLALALMDVRLPGIDGMVTAEKMRRGDRNKDVPIMFLTAFDGLKDEIEHAYSLGAVDFLIKPIVPKILLSKMGVFIDLYRNNRELKRQARLLRDSQKREHERQLKAERATWEAARLRREIELQRSIAEEKERSAVILQCIREAVIAIDVDRRVTLMNQAAEDLVGLTNEQARGKSVDDVVQLLNPETRARIVPENVTADGIAIASDGTERIVADSVGGILDPEGAPQGTVFVFRDVTTQRRMERDLQNQQRLESLGHLAGGIAHDFNNMLSMVLASSTILRREVALDGKGTELIQGIEDTCARASGLTRQLLTFSQGGAPVKEPCDFERLLRETVEMTLKGSGTRCTYQIEGPLWPADLDAGQISQVLSNLTLNAREATRDQGNIVFKARNLPSEAAERRSVGPGHFIELSVEDDGPGVCAKDAEVIFDPYFSTKSDHRGLGLSSAYSVVKRHGGSMLLDTAYSRGASFVLCLPANPNASVEQEPAESGDYAIGGHVLVMDDEPRLLQLLADCLVAIQCRVETAANGEQAVAMYQDAMERNDPFEVLILDLTVRGGMGGAETLQELKAIEPDVLAIACSGYANDPILCDHEKYGFAASVGKPFRFAVLARAVRTLVGRSRRLANHNGVGLSLERTSPLLMR